MKTKVQKAKPRVAKQKQKHFLKQKCSIETQKKEKMQITREKIQIQKNKNNYYNKKQNKYCNRFKLICIIIIILIFKLNTTNKNMIESKNYNSTCFFNIGKSLWIIRIL